MPRGDITGPAGVGPMTGRGMGVCAENNAPGYTMGGGGFGRAMGMGRGFRNRCFARWGTAPQAPVEPLNKMEQIAALKEQRNHIQQQLVTLEEQ
jgi:hypothetical protein